jgi:hypothetical protein
MTLLLNLMKAIDCVLSCGIAFNSWSWTSVDPDPESSSGHQRNVIRLSTDNHSLLRHRKFRYDLLMSMSSCVFNRNRTHGGISHVMSCETCYYFALVPK